MIITIIVIIIVIVAVIIVDFADMAVVIIILIMIMIMIIILISLLIIILHHQVMRRGIEFCWKPFVQGMLAGMALLREAPRRVFRAVVGTWGEIAPNYVKRLLRDHLN